MDLLDDRQARLRQPVRGITHSVTSALRAAVL
jgi:hypothetical protein